MGAVSGTVAVAQDDRVIDLFNESLERCRESRDFLDAFYDRFLKASPDIPVLFQGTDFRYQKRMLTISFYVLLGAAQGHPEGIFHIQRLADVHAARGVPGKFYDVWLECLVQTVSEYDRQYAPEIGDVWREFLGPAIEVMRAAAPS